MNLSKAKIAWITSLQIKKFRQKYNKFLVEGDKMVQELVQDATWEVSELYALEHWLESNQRLLTNARISGTPVTPDELKKISGQTTPNQVLAVVTPKEIPVQLHTLNQDISLFLDSIQDPGNLGSILRIADWFGIRHVFLGPQTVDVHNAKVVQATMGAFLRLSIHEASLAEVLEQYPKLMIYGADLQGENVFECTLPAAGILLVIGNEGNGLSADSRSLLHSYLTIPAASTGSGAESLNAAVATGILCAVLRQKRLPLRGV